MSRKVAIARSGDFDAREAICGIIGEKDRLTPALKDYIVTTLRNGSAPRKRGKSRFEYGWRDLHIAAAV